MEIRSVDCNLNQDFIYLITQSGDIERVPDYQCGKEYYLSPEVDDHILGEAVLDCLEACRWITYDDNPDFFYHEKNVLPKYKQWIENTMKEYGYKTKNKMFRQMDSCSFRQSENLIEISPSKHEKLEAWGREKDDGIEDVIIPADSTPAEIGAALKLAFSRCTSY